MSKPVIDLMSNIDTTEEVIIQKALTINENLAEKFKVISEKFSNQIIMQITSIRIKIQEELLFTKEDIYHLIYVLSLCMKYRPRDNMYNSIYNRIKNLVEKLRDLSK